jgi:hypothetical protein
MQEMELYSAMLQWLLLQQPWRSVVVSSCSVLSWQQLGHSAEAALC